MKKYLFLLFFLLVQFSWAGNSFLIRLERDESITEKFQIVHLSQRHCLVMANEADMLKLGWSNRSFKLLETNPAEGYRCEYFAVYPNRDECPNIDPVLFARYGTVLDIFDNQVIM